MNTNSPLSVSATHRERVKISVPVSLLLFSSPPYPPPMPSVEVLCAPASEMHVQCYGAMPSSPFPPPFPPFPPSFRSSPGDGATTQPSPRNIKHRSGRCGSHTPFLFLPMRSVEASESSTTAPSSTDSRRPLFQKNAAQVRNPRLPPLPPFFPFFSENSAVSGDTSRGRT